ncbi:hypothetical protein ACFL4J_00385, partial [Candidatus Margulisiibacteriota bacterium]
LNLDQIMNIVRALSVSPRTNNSLRSLAIALNELRSCFEMIDVNCLSAPNDLAQDFTRLFNLEVAPRNLYSIYARGLNKGFTHEQIIGLINATNEACFDQLSAQLTKVSETGWKGNKANQTQATMQAHHKCDDQIRTANEILQEMLASGHYKLSDFSSFHKEFSSILEEVVRNERISRWWKE